MKAETPHRLPVVNADTIEIDFSAVDTWLKCGKQYQFRYVQGKKSPPGIALLEGSAHHKAMEYNNNHKKEKGFDLKPKVVTDYFHDDFERRVKNEEQLEWNSENLDTVSYRAEALHRDYFRNVAPKIDPELIEHKFERVVTVEGLKFKLYGTLDLTEPSSLYDYKTCSKKWNQGDVDNNLQLSLYSFAVPKKEVGIIMFVKKAMPEVGILKSTRTLQQVVWALKTAKAVVNAIQAGSFPMTNPSSWACSKRFCGYWGECRGKYE